MKKYVVYYLLLLPLGAAISTGLSSLIHVALDMPRGVPLARLGLAGTIAQISLMVFPFIFAPIVTAIAFYGGNKRAPEKGEFKLLVSAVSILFALLWIFLLFGSGAWFGFLQGSLLFILGGVLGPPIIAAVLFWVLFSVSIWALMRTRA